MGTEIGEYLIGAYLKIIEKCNFVDYNVRHPGGGMKGLNEFDVIGIDFHKKIVYLCEVTTHILGINYGNPQKTIEKIEKKYGQQKRYAEEHFADFAEKHYMLWSPVVPKGISSELQKISGLELIINKEYTRRIEELKKVAKKRANDEGNPAFRLLQILDHMKKIDN